MILKSSVIKNKYELFPSIAPFLMFTEKFAKYAVHKVLSGKNLK